MWVLILLVFDFQRPVGALIDASETEAEPPTLYHKVPAALTQSMKTLRVNNLVYITSGVVLHIPPFVLIEECQDGILNNF